MVADGFSIAGMRIAYLLTSLGVGGAKHQAFAIAERMLRRGHTITILVPRPRLGQEWPSGLVIRYPGMPRTPVSVEMAFLRGASRNGSRSRPGRNKKAEAERFGLCPQGMRRQSKLE
jgi:hypothetical protein